MASVNSNHGKREKDIKNNNTVCLNSVCLNTAEQSELYLRALKNEKREEIESLSQKYEKKIRKDIKERPLKEKLADINMNKISVIIEFFVGVWYSDNTAIVIVIAAFFLVLGYMLEKKIAKQIDKKKGEMQEEEVRYSIEIIKNELSDLPIYKLDQKFTEEQMNKRRKTQHYRLKALLKIKIILEKSIIWTFAISIIICSYAFYRDYETKQIISINKETVQIGSVGEQGEKEQMDRNEITQPFSENNVSGESKDEKAVDQTEDAFRNLWNKYMGELETREIVNMDEALAIAKESCICWGENVDDELEWAYSDIETYGFSVFGKVKTQEEDISRRTNVNAKILLDLGRGYSEAVDEFLKSENTSYFTYRVVGLACLRGTDIYMSAVRHNITNHETKAECYKKTALLLREYADSVYENQKKNELDANIIDDWSKKEFILYIFSAVCYEEAEKLGDRSSAEEAIKMKLSANDNWKAFAS